MSTVLDERFMMTPPNKDAVSFGNVILRKGYATSLSHLWFSVDRRVTIVPRTVPTGSIIPRAYLL